MSDESATIVAQHHKEAVDAATGDMDLAVNSIVHRDHQHAIELLKMAIKHLETAVVIQKILKALPRSK